MRNQNLNVDIDLTEIRRAIKSGAVEPRKYVAKNGVEHNTITLFVRECKTMTETKTHNVTIKAKDSWKDAVDENRKTIYCGKANPSKFQPDGQGGTNEDGKSNDLDDLF